MAPGLRDDALVEAIRYCDAQVDDARHTMTLARTAAAHGASVATSTRVVDVLRQGDGVTGVVAECLETGAPWKRRHRIAADSALDVARIRRMLRRHGTEIDTVLDLVADDPDLGHPVGGADDHLRAEFVYPVSHEGGPAPRRRPHTSDPGVDRDAGRGSGGRD